MLDFITLFYFPQSILDFLASPILGIAPAIDYWLVFHYVTGILLGLVFLTVDRDKSYKYAFGILVLYEVFEYYLSVQGLTTKEPPVNIMLDIIAGFKGVLTGFFLGKKLIN